MRKIIIIAVVVAAVGLSGAPYLSGFIAERETRNLANTLNEDGRYGEFDIVAYERGMRSSRVEYEYKLPTYWQALSQTSDTVQYACDYAHGITGIVYHCDFKSDPVYQTMVDQYFAGDDPLSIKGNISAFGGFDQTIEIKALEQTLEDGAALKLAAVKVVIESDSGFKEHDGKARIGALEIASTDGSFTLADSEISWGTSTAPSGVMLVDFEVGVESLGLVDQQQTLSMRGLKMGATLGEKNSKLASKFLLALESINGAPVAIEDFKMRLDTAGLDSAAVLEYQAFIENIQAEIFKSLESGEAQTPELSRAMAMLPILEKMLNKGLGVKLDLNVRLDDTPNSLEFDSRLLEKTTFSQLTAFMFDPASILQHFDIRLSASLDAGLLDNKLGAGPILAASPMVVADGQTYKTSLKLGAQPELNGEPISIEELQTMLIQGGM